MSDIIKCEEVLNGIEVNWLKYEPPGGKGWHQLFEEEIAPILRESRAKAIKQKQHDTERLRNISRVQSLAAEILSKSNELATAITFLDAAPEDNLDLATRASGINGGARGIFKFADSLLQNDESVIAPKDLDEDIRFFDTFDDYIAADAELDKLLYAMHSVDIRYRAKILRACCRLLAVVETSREVIRNSKSTVLKLIEERIKPIFETLDKAYAVTGPHLRMMKKDYAKRGPAALADF